MIATQSVAARFFAFRYASAVSLRPSRIKFGDLRRVRVGLGVERVGVGRRGLGGHHAAMIFYRLIKIDGVSSSTIVAPFFCKDRIASSNADRIARSARARRNREASRFAGLAPVLAGVSAG